MITTLAALILSAPQGPVTNMKMVYEMPVVGGQREVVLGAKAAESAVLNGTYEREIAAKHLATGANTPGYVDNVVPGGTQEDNLGYFDCSSRPGEIFNKPCLVLTSNAKWIQKMGHKPHVVTWQNLEKQQWWVTADGTILRNYAALQTPEGTQTADCTYGKDSVQRRYTDVRGQTSFGEIFPSCGMDALNAQFKPMVVDGKLALRDKEYCVVNPLTGGLDKYSVHSAGTFKGEWLNASFKGRVFEIDGPNNMAQKVYLDDSGDIVKVSLSAEKYFVISVVPSSHLDENGHPIHRPGW